jgi:CubicO group peptidase (beta-lactamase class C family)
MVIASVSKLVTALTVARLAQHGELDLDAPVPWAAMGYAAAAGWQDVTARELLVHRSGMPIMRKAWINHAVDCGVPLAEALAQPPTDRRGEWVYSNGNYCALGELIEHSTGTSFADAADELVFRPAAITGPHLTTTARREGDGPYGLSIARLQPLGAAGTWMMSTDDITAMLAAVTAADRQTLVWPGVFLDQYGWGHTGTVDGAKSCAWVMEGGRTVVAATVAGNTPASGGKVCDVVEPALATDLGIWAGDPVRTPE